MSYLISREEERNLIKQNMIIIGRNIKLLRKEIGLTQEELAYEIDSEKTYINKIENNPDVNITLGMMAKICTVLKKPLYELFIEKAQ